MGDIEVPQPGASEIVGRLLSEALREHPDVQWLGLMSEDGFAIASEGPEGVDDDAVAAGAVRMMVQVRGMAKALGQSGTSQLFLEGSESGICVIDKDPWVLVMVGAPGVPIGLLRYEAREIAEAFPMGRRAELPAGETAEPFDAQEPLTEEQEPLTDEQQWWAADLAGPDQPVAVDPEPEPEIRWADEQTVAEPAGPGLVEEQVTDFPDWSAAESFDEPQPEPEAVSTFDLGDAVSFDLAPPADAVPAGFGVEDVPQFGDLPDPELADLADLAAPSGPAIDLPPPAGPAFELPPPE